MKLSNQWKTHKDDESGLVNVLPIGDTAQHKRTLECWCCPDETDPDVIVHNAHDGREAYEFGRRLPH